jgi:hypothetical protein
VPQRRITSESLYSQSEGVILRVVRQHEDIPSRDTLSVPKQQYVSVSCNFNKELPSVPGDDEIAWRQSHNTKLSLRSTSQASPFHITFHIYSANKLTKISTTQLKIITRAVGSGPLKDREDPCTTGIQQINEARSNKDHAEHEALQEEAHRQAALKAKKAEVLQRYAEEEIQRKHNLDLELRRIAVCRIRREEEERKASEEWHRRCEERKLGKRIKWLTISQALETQRLKEEARINERMDCVQRRIKGRRKEILLMAQRLSQDKDPFEVVLAGWTSVQSNYSPWKRRYFELSTAELKLFSGSVSLVHYA